MSDGLAGLCMGMGAKDTVLMLRRPESRFSQSEPPAQPIQGDPRLQRNSISDYFGPPVRRGTDEGQLVGPAHAAQRLGAGLKDSAMATFLNGGARDDCPGAQLQGPYGVACSFSLPGHDGIFKG